MLIGFSDGVFHKLFNDDKDRYSKKFLDLYFFNSLEIHCVNEGNIDFIINKLDSSHYSKFEYLSLHSINFSKDDIKNINLLKKIRQITLKFKIKNIVIHPDNINNWKIFNLFSDLPLSIENMDSDKNVFKSVEDFKNIIKETNLNITLDLNHIYTIDKSMKLADSFHKKFKNRITQYHISAYSKNQKHDSLFIKKQLSIIKALKFKEIPIIIESSLEDIFLLKKEYDYILKNLI